MAMSKIMQPQSDRRSRLVGAAAKLVHEEGFNRTTLADIAQESGVPVGYIQTTNDAGDSITRYSGPLGSLRLELTDTKSKASTAANGDRLWEIRTSLAHSGTREVARGVLRAWLAPQENSTMKHERHSTLRFPWAPAIAAIALLAACKGSGQDAALTADNVAAPAVRVVSAPATEMDVPIQLRLIGSLKGMREADLAANTAGRVTKTFVERGDQVQPGQIIAQIDTSNAALMLAEAHAQVATSRM